jgi:GalNAc-alpha-(1->4)-GalNAc-alpha-(1->3)-diNAcBac-PP-undecaprenol alpha-1,4-N-acetyl-D-galactosaminyltransferase
MEKTRVCCCINSLAPGGKERVMCELINGFISDHDAEVHVVLYGLNPEIFYEINPRAIIHKTTFKPINNRLILTIWTLVYLRKKIKQIAPDTVLSLGEIWNSFVLLALIGTRYPVFVSDRCRPNKSFGRFHDFLRKWLYPKATGVVAQTEKAKGFYQKQFKQSNIPVIGNPLNSIEIPKDTVRENIVVSVGRLIDTKNYDQLIAIFSRINNPSWKLVIVGGDALKQHNSEMLQKLINDSGMQDRIELAGTQKDINSYLLKSKIFAFTSSSEGFPNAIGEALAAGLPVVAYDCIAGPSDMVQDGENGYLIPLFDQVLFEEKLKQLMGDETLIRSMGNVAVESVKKYSVENIVSNYYKVITSK